MPTTSRIVILAIPSRRRISIAAYSLRENARARPVAFAVLKDHAGGKLIMDLICPVALMKNAITILNQELSKELAAAVSYACG